MSKALEIQFSFDDDSDKISLGSSKKINIIFSNNSLYDMQLFCCVSLPFGLSVSKNEFDIICPATGKTYYVLDIKLSENARLFYDTYSSVLNVFDTVSGSSENYSFDLTGCFDCKMNLSTFSRTYALETAQEYDVKISACSNKISRILLNGCEIKFDYAGCITTFKAVFAQGLNKLDIEFFELLYENPSTEFFLPSGKKASIPFLIGKFN